MTTAMFNPSVHPERLGVKKKKGKQSNNKTDLVFLFSNEIT